MNTTRNTQGYPDLKTGKEGIPRRVKKRPNLANLLRQARLEAGLPLKEAAKESGISVGSLSHLEQGKLHTTSLNRLIALAETYGIEPTGIIEAGGYDLTSALPTFTPYLRTKYRHLPQEAQDEITDAFQRIAAKYGIDGHNPGPLPGQDEDPQTTNHIEKYKE